MKRSRLIALVAAVVIVIAIAGGSAIYFSTRPTPEATDSAQPTESVPPVPSVLPTPEPGAVETPAAEALAPIETKIDEVATVAGGVKVSVLRMEAFEATSELPGDLAGPALAVTVQVVNDTDEPLNLAGAALELTYGPDATPAPPVGDPVANALPETLAPGETAEGEYSFTIPLVARGEISATLDLLLGEPQVAFRGAAPTQ